jgi:hypothetical protein
LGWLTEPSPSSPLAESYREAVEKIEGELEHYPYMDDIVLPDESPACSADMSGGSRSPGEGTLADNSFNI